MITTNKERASDRVIQPEVKIAARVMVADLWKADHAKLNQLAQEILPRYRYDQPLEMLREMTQSPMTVTMRPDGSRSIRYPRRFNGEEKYGDCVGLALKVLIDDDFNSWLLELENQSGSRVYPMVVFGIAPRYFLNKGMAHFWIMLHHEVTRTRLLVDPSLQYVGLGEGYRYEPENVKRVGVDYRIPTDGIACLQMAVGISGECGFSVLGMTPERKIIEIGFASGRNLAERITPLARLIDAHGWGQTYLLDRELGIVTVGSGIKPDASDLETLTRFFQISQELQFQIGGY